MHTASFKPFTGAVDDEGPDGLSELSSTLN